MSMLKYVSLNCPNLSFSFEKYNFIRQRFTKSPFTHSKDARITFEQNESSEGFLSDPSDIMREIITENDEFHDLQFTWVICKESQGFIFENVWNSSKDDDEYDDLNYYNFDDEEIQQDQTDDDDDEKELDCQFENHGQMDSDCPILKDCDSKSSSNGTLDVHNLRFYTYSYSSSQSSFCTNNTFKSQSKSKRNKTIFSPEQITKFWTSPSTPEPFHLSETITNFFK